MLNFFDHLIGQSFGSRSPNTLSFSSKNNAMAWASSTLARLRGVGLGDSDTGVDEFVRAADRALGFGFLSCGVSGAVELSSVLSLTRLRALVLLLPALAFPVLLALVSRSSNGSSFAQDD